MQALQAQVMDALKARLGVMSDAQLAVALRISRDSVSGMRTGRLVMGEAIRWTVMTAWVARSGSQAPWSPQALCATLQGQGLRVQVESGCSVDAVLLALYKAHQGWATDAPLAQRLGVRRPSLSMVRAGRNGLGPLSLLRIHADVNGVSVGELEAAVGSVQGLWAWMKGPSSQPHASFESGVGTDVSV